VLKQIDRGERRKAADYYRESYQPKIVLIDKAIVHDKHPDPSFKPGSG
jgi:hypothetical protein